MFLFKRGIFHISLLLAIILFSFVLFHAIPSDPARLILGPNADESRVAALKKELGLDQTLYVQFLTYLKKLSRFDLGRSYMDSRPVATEVAASFKVTLVLTGICMAMVLTYSLFAIFTICIKRPITPLNALFISTPTFFSGLLVALVSIRVFSFSTFNGEFEDYNAYLSLLPPAFALAVYPMGILSTILAKEFKTILSAPYILTARAYAVPPKIIFYKYALRNALIPYLSAISNQLPALFTGAFIVEIIFSLPGAGTLMVKSIFSRDFPMLEGLILVNGILFITTNLFFEAIYPIIDHRVKMR